MNKTSIHKSAIAGMVLIMAIMFLFADMPFTKKEVVCATENNGDEGTFPWSGEFSTTLKNTETTKKTPQTTKNNQQTTNKNQLATTKVNDKGNTTNDKNAKSSNTEEVVAKRNIKISKAKITKIKKNSSKKVSVKLKKIKDVNGYQIKISMTKKFKGKGTKSFISKKNTISIKKLKIGNTYFVKARGYKIVDGVKYYGKWSKIKKIK